MELLSLKRVKHHMKKASITDLRHRFDKIERLLRQSEEIQITKRGKVFARLRAERHIELLDFLARLRKIYGTKMLRVSGAKLIAKDRSRY